MAGTGGGEPQIEFQYRFVANTSTATRAARTTLRRALHARRFWGGVIVVWAAFTGFYASGVHAPALEALFVGAVWAAAETAIITAPVIGLMYWAAVSGARRSLAAGALLQSGFGEDAFIVGTPYTSTSYSYAGVRAVSIEDEFVMIRHEGQTPLITLPRPLVPYDAMLRLRAGRQPTRRR